MGNLFSVAPLNTYVKFLFILHDDMEEDLDLFSIVDTTDEVVDVINNFYKKHLLSPNF